MLDNMLDNILDNILDLEKVYQDRHLGWLNALLFPPARLHVL